MLFEIPLGAPEESHLTRMVFCFQNGDPLRGDVIRNPPGAPEENHLTRMVFCFHNGDPLRGNVIRKALMRVSQGHIFPLKAVFSIQDKNIG